MRCQEFGCLLLWSVKQLLHSNTAYFVSPCTFNQTSLRRLASPHPRLPQLNCSVSPWLHAIVITLFDPIETPIEPTKVARTLTHWIKKRSLKNAFIRFWLWQSTVTVPLTNLYTFLTHTMCYISSLSLWNCLDMFPPPLKTPELKAKASFPSYVKV